MNLLPHMVTRIFGSPLMIHRPKLEIILSVLGARIGLPDTGLLSHGVQQRTAREGLAGIAVLPVHGTLVRRAAGLEVESGLASYAHLASMLDAAIADPDISAILLDIDSPGGESGGVFDLADKIALARQIKPVWAMANEAAFSAAYAIGSAASRLFITRTGGVGSIGVIAMHADQSIKDAQDGVRYTTVYAGARKNDLNPHEPMSDEAHAFLKTEVDRVYALFVETVARHRGLSADAVRATEAGIYYGADAVAAGLADALGTFDEVLAELADSLVPSAVSNRHALPVLAAQGIPSQTELETFMNDEPGIDPAGDLAGADPANPPPAVEPAVTDSPSMTLEDAEEVAQLCAIAGQPELTASYLAARTPPAVVRGQLLARRAQSAEIRSVIAPDAHAAQHLPDNNPLMSAVKKLNHKD